jgi:hypothetical protein
LGALVGGFLDVHAIIRLEGAASSWYPVYDRVLPACAERSAAAPLGAALHPPIDRRIRRASAAAPSGGVWRRLCARSAALAADGADAALLPGWAGRTRR